MGVQILFGRDLSLLQLNYIILITTFHIIELILYLIHFFLYFLIQYLGIYLSRLNIGMPKHLGNAL